ncbi:hypothetical protein EJ02DRAFT_187975 [Clathrospora elynae]|uniref:Uncharacterized protein n=1 Tax=Clathrospora elynae TaxID=706981 RepID=A0A6A5SY41_9PLEO|nr:hypothetical protein EJ02DRAFT_187975 [Clathrospora elynae]
MVCLLPLLLARSLLHDIRNMATGIVYVVIRRENSADAFTRDRNIAKPYHRIVEAVPSDQKFTYAENTVNNTYGVEVVENSSGERRTLRLEHNKSLEEDVQIAGHNDQGTTALQFLKWKSDEHIKGLKDRGIMVDQPRLSSKVNDSDELRTRWYTARECRTLGNRAVVDKTIYWWDVITVTLKQKGVEVQVHVEHGE